MHIDMYETLIPSHSVLYDLLDLPAYYAPAFIVVFKPDLSALPPGTCYSLNATGAEAGVAVDLYLDYASARRRHRRLRQSEVSDVLASVMTMDDRALEDGVDTLPYSDDSNLTPAAGGLHRQGRSSSRSQQQQPSDGGLRSGGQRRRRLRRRRSASRPDRTGPEGLRRSLLDSGPLAFDFSSADAGVNAVASTFCLPSDARVASAAVVLSVNGTTTSLLSPGLVYVSLSLNQVLKHILLHSAVVIARPNPIKNDSCSLPL
jgi:hypothetical protein